MNRNIEGLIISFCFFCLLFIVTTILNRLNILHGEKCRKFIHVITGFWWIIAMTYFDHYLYAGIIPFSFIILNYLSHKFNLVKIIERKNDDNLGVVYYPVSLFLLVILTFGILNKPYIGAIGILIMAYGDGLAAIVGNEVRSKKLYRNKTLVGSLTMYIISVLFTTLILLKYNQERMLISIIVIPVVATVVELFSRKGLDNLFVPLISSLTYLLIISF